MKIILSLFVFALIMINAPAIASEPDSLQRIEINKEYTGMSKDVLFSKIRRAIGIVMGSSKSVIDTADKEVGNIIGSCICDLVIDHNWYHECFSKALLTIECKIVIDIKNG